jgi:21S rRNA (GM2251-2'-O)-methyltransferase
VWVKRETREIRFFLSFTRFRRDACFLLSLILCHNKTDNGEILRKTRDKKKQSPQFAKRTQHKKKQKTKKMLRLVASSSLSACGLRTTTTKTSSSTTSLTMFCLRANANNTTTTNSVVRNKRLMSSVRANWRMDDVVEDDSTQQQRQQRRTSSGRTASSSSSSASFSRGLNGNRREYRGGGDDDDDDDDDYRDDSRRGGQGRGRRNNNSGGGRRERGRGGGGGGGRAQRNTYYENNYNNNNNNNSYYGNDEYEDNAYGNSSRNRQGGGGGGYYNDNNKPAYLQRKEERKATREQPTLREMALGEVIFGQNPVKEALLQNKRDEFYRLWIQEGDGGSYSSDEKMIARAKELGCTISYASKHDLNMLTESRPHQGVALDCTPLEMDSIESLLEENSGGKNAAEIQRNRQHPLWLALDEIIDPQNFGAILRTAHFLNIDGVVVCAKNSAPLSPVVSKASSGAMETIKVYQTNAMHKFLAKCVDDGFNVIGLANQSGAESVSDLSLNQPTVLVVGNEGSGLRTNVRRACSRIAKIEGGDENNNSGKTTSVESLNVSVATAIALFQLTSKTNE